MALVITGGIQFTGGFSWINPPITYFSDPYYNLTVLHLAGETPAPLFLSDASGSLNSITTAGNVTGSRFSPVSPVGYYSLSFNGTSGYVALGGSSVFAFGTANWTIEFWVYFNSVGGASQVMYSSEGTGAYITAPDIYINSSGKFVVQVGSSVVINGTGPTTVVAGQWYHVALVRNGATSSLYVNGKFEASYADANTYVIASNRPLLGVYGYSASSYLNGSLSNLRVVNGTALYTANFTPPTQPLTVIGTQTAVLACSGPSVTADYSGRWNILTSAGVVKVQTANPFGVTSDTATMPAYQNGYYSNYFNGTSAGLTVSTPATYLDIGASGSCSIECWVYTTATQTTAFILTKDGVASTNYSEYAFTVNSNVINFNVGVATGAVTTQVMAVGTPTLNSWNHIVASRIGTNWSLYLNGALTNVVAQTVTPTPGGRGIIIGNQGNGTAGNGLYAGYISNVRIVIGSVVYSGAVFTPPTQPLTVVNGTQTVLLTCLNNQLTDSSPWANTLTNNSSATTVSALVTPFTVPTTQVTGVTNYGSGQFDGTTGFLRTAYTPSINLSGSDWSIDGWLYWNGTTTNSTLLDKDGVSGSSYPSYNIGLTGAGLLTGTVGSGTGTTYIQTVTSNIVLTTSSWVHFALAKSGTAMTLYQNGVSVAATNLTGTIVDGGKPLNIGYQTGQAATSYWNGYLSNLRIVRGAAVYTSNFAVPTQPLTVANGTTGTTTLLTLQYKQSNNNNVVLDDSPNNFAITATGTPTQGTFTPFSQNGWSNYFDGSTGYLTIPTTTAFGFGTSSYTIEFWFNTNTNTPTPRNLSNLVDFRPSGTITAFVPNVAYQGAGLGNNIFFYYNGGQRILTSTISISTWYHVALVRNGNIFTLFLNGISQGTYSDSTSNGTTNGMIAGHALADANGDYLNGYISNLRVVNGSALYTTNFTPPTAPLTAVSGTVLLTAQSNRFVDNSSSATTITSSGTVAVKSFAPFTSNMSTVPSGLYSVYFSVIDTSYLTITNNALLDFGGNNFTAECWIYPITFDSADGGFMGVGAQAGSGSWILRGTAAGAVSFVTWSGGTTVDVNITSGSGYLALNAWSHVAVTRNGTLFTIWVNGVSAITGTSSNAIGNTGRPAFINYSYGSGSNRSNICYISNVRWTNGSALYISAFKPSTVPLTTVTNTTGTVVLLTCQNNSFTDSSILSNAITANGSTALVLTTPFIIQPTQSTVANSYSTTLVGGSMYFNGSTDYLTGPSNAGLTLTGQFTIEFWFYATSQGSTGAIALSKNATYATSGQVYIMIGHTGNTTQVQLWQNGLNAFITSSNTFSNNQWYHCAVTRNASNLVTLWINGVNNGTYTNAGTFDYSSFSIGSNPSDGGATVAQLAFGGYLSNLRIVNGAALYTATFAVPTLPPSVVSTVTSVSASTSTIASTSLLLLGTNSGVVDQTGRNDLITAGTATISASTFKTGVSSVYIPGTGNYVQTAGTNYWIPTTLSTFTVEAWIYMTQLPTGAYPAMVGDMTPTSTTDNWSFGPASSGQLQFYWNPGSATSATGNTVMTTSTWNHVAVSVNSGTILMFVNGVSQTLTGTTTLTSRSSTLNYLTLGQWTSGTYQYYGYIDDLRITQGVARYTSTATFVAPTIGLPVQ